MAISDIAALPVADLAAPNCALFLWVTWPQLPAGLQVIDSWGFEYKTIAFTWIKTTKTGKLAWGMGNWTRANSEPCLLGIKGRLKKGRCRCPLCDYVTEESTPRKPDEVRERIVQLLGDVPKIELFARQKVSGWDCWGNEVERDIDIKNKVIARKYAIKLRRVSVLLKPNIDYKIQEIRGYVAEIAGANKVGDVKRLRDSTVKLDNAAYSLMLRAKRLEQEQEENEIGEGIKIEITD